MYTVSPLIVLVIIVIFSLFLTGSLWAYDTNREEKDSLLIKPQVFYTSAILTFFLLIFLCCSFIITFGIVEENNKLKKEVIYLYDGEGNKIPNHIVELEVKSHFVKLKQSEKDSINKYFYLDTLK